MMDKVAFGIDDLEDALSSAGSAISGGARSAYNTAGNYLGEARDYLSRTLPQVYSRARGAAQDIGAAAEPYLNRALEATGLKTPKATGPGFIESALGGGGKGGKGPGFLSKQLKKVDEAKQFGKDFDRVSKTQLGKALQWGPVALANTYFYGRSLSDDLDKVRPGLGQEFFEEEVLGGMGDIERYAKGDRYGDFLRDLAKQTANLKWAEDPETRKMFTKLYAPPPKDATNKKPPAPEPYPMPNTDPDLGLYGLDGGIQVPGDWPRTPSGRPTF